MKTALTILLLTLCTASFAQQKDTVVIKLSPFQQEQIEAIDKKKAEILSAMEKQKKELFAQLDERANLILLLLLDNKSINMVDIESLKYKDGSLFITKKYKEKP